MYISFIALCPFHFHFTTKPKTESGKYPNVRIATIPSPHQMLLFVWLFSFEHFFFNSLYFVIEFFPIHTQRVRENLSWIHDLCEAILLQIACDRTTVQNACSAIFFGTFFLFSPSWHELNWNFWLRKTFTRFSNRLFCILIQIPIKFVASKIIWCPSFCCVFFQYVKIVRLKTMKKLAKTKVLLRLNISLCWNWVLVFASN